MKKLCNDNWPGILIIVKVPRNPGPGFPFFPQFLLPHCICILISRPLYHSTANLIRMFPGCRSPWTKLSTKSIFRRALAPIKAMRRRTAGDWRDCNCNVYRYYYYYLNIQTYSGLKNVTLLNAILNTESGDRDRKRRDCSCMEMMRGKGGAIV